MNAQPRTNLLYRQATLAGYGAVAVAGALTVGLIAGVAYPAITASQTSTSHNSTTSTTGSTTGTATQSGSSLGAAAQATTAVAGSHGS